MAPPPDADDAEAAQSAESASADPPASYHSGTGKPPPLARAGEQTAGGAAVGRRSAHEQIGGGRVGRGGPGPGSPIAGRGARTNGGAGAGGEAREEVKETEVQYAFLRVHLSLLSKVVSPPLRMPTLRCMSMHSCRG
jgi:hypothetical protein